MYVTAQRVRSPETGREGINAFYYLHGGPAQLPEVNRGTLYRKLVSLDPPGNRVRSFLDMVAPDASTLTVLRYALMQLIATQQHQPLPWVGAFGTVQAHFGADDALATQWQREITDLYRAIEAVRLDH